MKQMIFGSFCITSVNMKILFHCMQSQNSVFPLVFGQMETITVSLFNFSDLGQRSVFIHLVRNCEWHRFVFQK